MCDRVFLLLQEPGSSVPEPGSGGSPDRAPAPYSVLARLLIAAAAVVSALPPIPEAFHDAARCRSAAG